MSGSEGALRTRGVVIDAPFDLRQAERGEVALLRIRILLHRQAIELARGIEVARRSGRFGGIECLFRCRGGEKESGDERKHATKLLPRARPVWNGINFVERD